MLSVNSIGINQKTKQNKPSFKGGTYTLTGTAAEDAGRIFTKKYANDIALISKIKLATEKNTFSIKCEPSEYPTVSGIMSRLAEQFQSSGLRLSAKLSAITKPYSTL